jgi:eukaryotic translation initiation factor 2C
MKAPDTKDKLAREHRQHDDRDRVVYSANRRESTSSSPSSYPHDGRRESTSSSPSSSYPQDGRREERRDTSSSYPYDGRREDRRDTSSSSYPFDGRREDRRDTSSSSYPYDGRREDRRDTSSSYPYDGRREERRDTSSSYPYDGRREDRRGSLYPYDSRRTDNYSYFDGPQEMPRREEQHRRDDRRWDSEQAATVAPFRGSSFPRDPREQKQHKKDWSQGNQHTFKPPIAATKRRTVQVKTNILSASVNVPPDCGFHQYHVEITPNVPFKYKHMIISAMFQKRLRCLGPNVRFVFNGDSQLFLVHKCGDDSSSGFQAKFEVMIGDGADARSINVSVVATFVKTIPMEDIVAFMRAQDFAPAQTDSPTEIISTYNTMLSHSHYVPGTNFFIRNALFSSKVTIPMDDIFSLWTGIRATLDLYKDGSAGVTISSCVTPVYHETNVLAFLKKSRRHIPWDRADDNFVHNEMYMRDLLTMLKGQRLATKHTKYNHRLYQVVGITPVPVQELAFVKEGTETHLVDYFKTTYDIDLTHTHLPALEMKSTSGNKVYMPLTLCSIPAGSRVMHLSDAEHGQIIKKSNMPPAAKLSQLEEIVRNLNLSEDETCKEFGLEVSSEFKQVTGTMLPMPTIFYKDTESMPRQGTWTTQKGDRMMKPCDVNAIVVFSMDRKLQPRAADDFIAGLVSMALDRGAFIQKPHIVKCRELDRNDFSFGNQETAGRAIEQKLPASLRSNSTLVFVFLADQDSTVYKTIKAVFSKLGVFSSCIQSRQLSGKKLEPVYNNLLSKFNFRCGGQNFAPVMSTTPKDGKMLLFAGEFIMLCGISIFVGGPSSPTFVVVSMACNPEATRYVTRSLLLPPKQTIIYGLKNIFIDLLKAIYMMFDHNKPTQIIVYRSGVSEHQIVNIQKSEVEDIRQACRDIQADGTYMPRIVFYGERSNHDVRMFPKNAQDADRSGNFAAGLVVDDPSVNKYPGDFFLVSQAGLQGVSCPPQYMHIHSWWPKETFSLELEKFQELTFSLCSQQNCQRFVSAPSPLSVATALCESLQAHYSVTSRNGVFGDLSHPDTLAAIQRDLAAHPDLEGTMYYF